MEHIKRPLWYVNRYKQGTLNLSNNVCYDNVLMSELDINVSFQELNEYPDAANIYFALGKYHNVDVKNLAVGYGSGDIIFRIFQLFKDYKIGILVPTYELAYIFAINLGMNVITSEDIDNINTDILYIANPNGVTGEVVSKEKILELSKKYKLMIVDEAYGDFCNLNFSVLDESARYDNIIVIKTFSKTIASPGVRFGYCVSNETFINNIQENRSSTVITGFTTNIILELIKHIPAHISRMLKTRKYIEEKYNCITSHGNFVLFKKNPAFNCEIKKTSKGLYRMALTDLETFKKIEND